MNRPNRPRVKRAVVVLPSAFTLGNLFFGFWAIVSAASGDFQRAGWFVVLAGVMDMLDGRIARLSKTASRFGAELDSLVDVLSFGMAPALLMYHLEFADTGGFAWLIPFGYVIAVAVRLARYNVSDHSTGPQSWFVGLPSPAAGMLLAVYYPFSQTSWHAATLGRFGQQLIIVLLMILVSVLMVSNVRYPKFPGLGIRSARGIFGLVLTIGILAGGLLVPEYFFFPFGLTYVSYGLVRAVVLALHERGDDDGHQAGQGTGHPAMRLHSQARPTDSARSKERQ